MIVDDLGFFGQHYFSDDVIAQAVQTAINSGVVYISSAGNQAQVHYQGQWSQSTGSAVHDFDPTGTEDEILDIGIVPPGGTLDVILQWSDPLGGSGNDYNLGLWDFGLGGFRATSAGPQTGTQNPIEGIIGWTNLTGLPVNLGIVVDDFNNAASRELELFVLPRNFGLANLVDNDRVTTDSIIGHAAVSGVISVAAIDAADPGNDTVEIFSSQGASTIYTDFATQTTTRRNSLDGAGIDGVETAIGGIHGIYPAPTPSNPNALFFGTSAAAPHVAGIAALLLDINPLLTPAGLSAHLARYAVDILADNYDVNSGFGRFDALASATSGIDLPKVVDVVLDGATWTRDAYSFSEIIKTDSQLAPIFTQGVDTIQVAFSEPVVMNGSELTLVRSGGAVVTPNAFNYNLVTQVATWTFANPLPADKYRIELSTAIEDADGNALDGDWDNLFGVNGMGMPTPDDFADDPTGRALLSGNGVAGGDFSFFFSLLPGDSNQDGVVTNADAVLATVADVNGDGLHNGTDVALVNGIVSAGVNTSLPVRNRLGVYDNRGDYSDDEIVNQSDYQLWKITFGSTTDLRADGNGDGTVNAADYTSWRDNLGDYSAWYTGALGSGSGSAIPLVLFGTAPQVANVTISGSTSTHAPYSFDSHDGSGEQLRTVPVGAADTIAITFTEDVNLVGSDLAVIGLTSANRPALADFSYDLGTMTATWRFEGWALGDQYLLSLSDAVTDVEGMHLDGEWTNPASLFTTNTAVSQFPSGNGAAGGDFNFVMTLLPGDANLDLIVDSADMSILVNNYNLPGALFTDGDFSGNGLVDQPDTILWAENWLANLNLQNLSVLSDLNGDWIVDDTDRDILFANFLAGTPNPTQADGDLTGDGVINVEDLDLMFAQFGLELSVVS